MEELIITVVIVAFVAAVPISFFYTSRRHNPKRARAMTEVCEDGTFSLDVENLPNRKVFFRFQIRGWTDDDYDLLVTGDVTGPGGAKQPFAWRTSAKSVLPGASGAQGVSIVSHIYHDMGSFRLARLPRDATRVLGTVAAPGDLLIAGWVYVPR